MRIDVEKYLFYGLDLEAFFLKAQKIGVVQFIEDTSYRAKEMPPAVENCLHALKVLRRQPVLPQEELQHIDQADGIVRQVNQLDERLEKLKKEKRNLRQEIGRVSVFGGFSFEDIRSIERLGRCKVRFFFAKRGKLDPSALPVGMIYVATAHGLDYFFSVSLAPFAMEELIEMKIDRELGALKSRKSEVLAEIEQTEKELKRLYAYYDFTHKSLLAHTNSYRLQAAKEGAKRSVEGRLFYTNGWVPANKQKELEQLLGELNVTAERVALEPGEIAPTFLENEGVTEVGEDLVHIYDTPSNQDKDPSLWVLISFAIFFAMIIGDGGYGLVFLAASLYLRYKNPNMRAPIKRGWTLSVILCVSCIVWGLLTNSFFGIEVSPDSTWRRVSLTDWLVEKKADYHVANRDLVFTNWTVEYAALLNVESGRDFLLGGIRPDGSYEIIEQFTDSVMMELALLVGMIHTSLSLLRYLKRNPAALGWVLVILGCYLYFPLLLKSISMLHYLLGVNPVSSGENGLYLIYGGLGLTVLLALIKEKWLGLLEISNFIQIFADVLSYLRLYALAMAGAIISATVNEIAAEARFIVGALILLVGHFLNMLLSVIGGVIHGLRLNFIEWYHYSFEGGGKLYTPLKKIEID